MAQVSSAIQNDINEYNLELRAYNNASKTGSSNYTDCITNYSQLVERYNKLIITYQNIREKIVNNINYLSSLPQTVQLGFNVQNEINILINMLNGLYMPVTPVASCNICQSCDNYEIGSREQLLGLGIKLNYDLNNVQIPAVISTADLPSWTPLVYSSLVSSPLVSSPSVPISQPIAISQPVTISTPVVISTPPQQQLNIPGQTITPQNPIQRGPFVANLTDNNNLFTCCISIVFILILLYLVYTIFNQPQINHINYKYFN